jgi:hypothetical protein
MNKIFGGKQIHMHKTKIMQEDGYLGPYTRKLNVGDIQEMSFSETDEGPYYLTESQRQSRKWDRVIGTTKYNFNASELRSQLIAHGIQTPPKGAKKIKEKCVELEIPLSKMIDKIEEGWVNKPKGKLQVLWERGLIDESKGTNYYTNKGQRDVSGEFILATSLDHLLSMCKDFNEEESMLQYMGKQMGIIVEHSPVCHAELAGEGIEYVWGLAKNKYRQASLNEKRKKESFKNLVSTCLSRDWLTTERVRRCALRARCYSCAYWELDHQSEPSDENKDSKGIVNEDSIPIKIEKLFKKYKTHRSAIDFNYAFIQHTIRSTMADDEENKERGDVVDESEEIMEEAMAMLPVP